MIIEKVGNLLDHVNNGIIAHGCNCRGGFGAGFAKYVGEKYPETKRGYISKYNKEGWKLGDIQLVKVKPDLYVANMATQDRFWKEYEGEVLVDYVALCDALEELKKKSLELGLPIYIPKIGCGLAGGNWEKVKKYINLIFEDTDITVFNLSKGK